MNNQEINSVWFRAYYKGFQVSLTFGVTSPAQAITAIEDAIASGFLPTAEDVKNGEHKELIDTVVRREHIDKRGQIVPVIDLYPKWQGDFGQFRFTSVYLDNEEQVAEFEAQSGLRLDKLPVYESQAPLQRNPARPHRCEITCPTPFEAIKQQNGEKEVNGVTQMTYKFARYATPKPLATPAPTERKQAPPPTRTQGELGGDVDTEYNFFFVEMKQGKSGEGYLVYQAEEDNNIKVNVFKGDRIKFTGLPTDKNLPAQFVGTVKRSGNFWNLNVVTSFS